LAFKEADRKGTWTLVPLAERNRDPALYRFLIELQIGQITSLHRDVMGPEFSPDQVNVVFARPEGGTGLDHIAKCDVVYDAPANQMIFSSAWLDRPAKLGNPLTFSSIIALCDSLLEEMEISSGAAGQVRQVILRGMGRDISFATACEQLKISPR